MKNEKLRVSDFRPQLVCLDLSDCEFQDQQVLMNALSTLPHLRTLVLEGNPLTLASCYPGFTVESLPQLSYLDGSWVSPEERQCFRGLAKMSGETLELSICISESSECGRLPLSYLLSMQLCHFLHI